MVGQDGPGSCVLRDGGLPRCVQVFLAVFNAYGNMAVSLDSLVLRR